ncbi:MAG TPA: hypothetical protein VF746_16330 [Longimicrobium sp.]|jgi:hypothetical protein
MRPLPSAARAGASLCTLLSAAAPCRAQASQVADTAFDASVAEPAYPRGSGPRVVIDAAHFNVHTAEGRYRPFATLLANDGFRVAPGRRALDAAALRAADVLVIANALGDSSSAEAAARPAFTAEEVEAVWRWVDGGGALLLVADHEPAGAAARRLAARFGVDMSTGRTFDDPHSDWTSGSPTWLVFQRDTGARILDHPITRGRGERERIRRVETFSGQSLAGPPGSVGFLALAPGAVDRFPGGRAVPADGRAQAVALTVGRGRVVVLGEAALLTAQVTSAGGRTVRFGWTWPDNDDRQLALNIVRWLAGALQ